MAVVAGCSTESLARMRSGYLICIVVAACGSGAVSSAPCESMLATATHLEPQLAIAAFGGRLVGSNEGEWGGKLTFEPSGGSPAVLAEDNIINIIEMPTGFVAVAGLAHLSIKRGAVYVIDPDAGGIPRAEGRVLPGNPISIKKLGADIIIATSVRTSYTSPAKLEYFKLAPDRSIAPLKCE